MSRERSTGDYETFVLNCGHSIRAPKWAVTPEDEMWCWRCFSMEYPLGARRYIKPSR